MGIYIIAIFIIAIVWLNKKAIQTRDAQRRFIIERKSNKYGTPNQQPMPIDEPLPITGAYQKKWILSYNEKNAYKALKALCDEKKLYLMTKVRLLDLVEPIKGNSKYKTYFYKIQAKHVDFVICDKSLTAQCIIELDDSSHNRIDRIERDKFVDEVLRSVGYTIIHTWGITEQTKSDILKALNITSSQQPGI